MKESLRVLQVIDGLNVGGAERLLLDLVAGLHSRGYLVKAGYSTPGPLAGELTRWAHRAGAPFPAHLPRASRFDPRLLGKMIALVRAFKPQIVHTHLIKSDFFGRLAARWCSVPVIVSTLHNTDPWARRWPLGWVYGLNARLADRLIAVSDDVRAYYHEHAHIPEDKIVAIANGVDVERFASDPAAGRRLRSELGLGSEIDLVGIIGRLQPQKDHETFLKAAAQVLQQAPETHFLVVGDGPLRVGLEDMAQKLGVAAKVHFCGLRADIPAVLSALDILVFSSRWEGLPVTLLEGMAAGRAIAATAVAGIQSVVRQGESALLVAPGSPGELAAACLELLGDPALRQRLGAGALRAVKAQYSLDAMIERTDQVYRQALAERSILVKEYAP